MASRKLVLFDFDGTLTDRDTMLSFVRHCRGPLRFWAGLLWLAPLLVGLRLKLVPAVDAKRLFLRHFFGGWHRDALDRHAQSFADHIEAWIRPAARARLEEHRQEGDDVVVVSASLDLWLAPFMAAHELPCLCTEAAYDEDGSFRGELATPNCNGAEKVRRVRDAFDLERYDHVVAYGDSSGDQPMLAIADEPVYKPFRR